MRKGLLLGFLFLTGLLGWALAFQNLKLYPGEVFVTIPVTQASLNHAKELCVKYMVTAKGVMGSVQVKDSVGNTYTLPCRVVLEEK